MNRSPSSREVLSYFSQFLSEISAIMGSIKAYMYQLIEVPMPAPKVHSVFNSMSSIIFSTHKTYADLRKIESVLAGYTRSRLTAKLESSLNSTKSTSKRSSSQQQPFDHTLLHLPKGSIKRGEEMSEKVTADKEGVGSESLLGADEIGLRIEGLMVRNKDMFARLAARNRECLQLVLEAKRQLCLQC